MKKNLPFHVIIYHLVFLYFSTSGGLLPCIMKHSCRERLHSSSTNQGLLLEQCNGKIKLITHSCSPFRNNYRTSHQKCSMKKGILRNFTKFKGKQLCQSLFSNIFAALRLENLFKKRLQHRCFPVNFAKFLRTPFLQNTSGRLIL